ncbi:MAG TPA: HisA/HisF-related TIM barrel protein [Anaerolineae bacterium]|nr:HisA/HisF-related TIM barrel protein [Anaerolineae bacterium]
MIELAPQHKTGLALRSPIMPAAGCAGFGNEYAGLIDWSKWGAFVTNPVTARPRKPVGEPVHLDLGAAVLIHVGIPNPGIRAVLEDNQRVWPRLAAPVIVHVSGTTPDDVAECIVRLAIVEEAAGAELGVRDEEDEGAIVALLRAAIEAGEKPVLARLPLERAAELAPACVEAGATALVVAAPPRGTLPWGDGYVSGRVYGRGTLPLALRAVRETIARVNVPIVASGGVHTVADAQALLATGAAAVQIDALIWRDPKAAQAIAEAFAKAE